jgi:hypothetical protein
MLSCVCKYYLKIVVVICTSSMVVYHGIVWYTWMSTMATSEWADVKLLRDCPTHEVTTNEEAI